MKKIFTLKIFLIIFLLLYMIPSFETKAYDDGDVDYDFDYYSESVDENETMYEFVGYKTIDFSILYPIDYYLEDNSILQLANLGNVTVEYHTSFEFESRRVYMWTDIQNVSDLELTIPQCGNVLVNPYGEYDLLLSVEDNRDYSEFLPSDIPLMENYIWLSDLDFYTRLSNGNAIGRLFDFIKKIVVQEIVNPIISSTIDIVTTVSPIVKPLVAAGLHTVVYNLQSILSVDGCASVGSFFLQMKEETDSYGNDNGIYHASFDCWQQYLGYNDFYDTLFDTGTEMIRNKTRVFLNTFVNEEEYLRAHPDYVVWLWVGNYLNLGSGLEMGIYKLDKVIDDKEFFVVDKKLATNMEIHLLRTDLETDNVIINHWNANDEKQWWITGFNSNHQWVDIEYLRATFKIEFHPITTDELNFTRAFDRTLGQPRTKDEIKWNRDYDIYHYYLSFSKSIQMRAIEQYEENN